MVKNIYRHSKLILYFPIPDSCVPNNLFYSIYVLCIMYQILRLNLAIDIAEA